LAAAEGSDVPGLDGKITVNGFTITVEDTDKFEDIADHFENETGGAVTAKFDNGRLTLTSANGAPINLADVDANEGLLGKLGLTAGTTQAKLEADTSITLNGTEIKLTKGSDMEAV